MASCVHSLGHRAANQRLVARGLLFLEVLNSIRRAVYYVDIECVIYNKVGYLV